MHDICAGTFEEINHGVVAIGWTEDSEGQEVWIIRNSWGGRWGENGYMRLERSQTLERDNACGILEINTFPQVHSDK
jgi:C1A family cysteine protease